jgi:hypothetical protein
VFWVAFVVSNVCVICIRLEVRQFGVRITQGIGGHEMLESIAPKVKSEDFECDLGVDNMGRVKKRSDALLCE